MRRSCVIRGGYAIRDGVSKTTPKILSSLPTGFIPASWRKVVIIATGIDRKYYELCDEDSFTFT
jgi:hypothetical protein